MNRNKGLKIKKSFIVLAIINSANAYSVEHVPGLEWSIGASFSDVSLTGWYHGCGTSVGRYQGIGLNPKILADNYCRHYQTYNSCVISKGFISGNQAPPSIYQTIENSEYSTNTQYRYKFNCSNVPSNSFAYVQAFVFKSGPEVSRSPKNLGEPQCSLQTGNPINAATGNKFQHELIYKDFLNNLNYEAKYNSLDSKNKPLGQNWTTSYDMLIGTEVYSMLGRVSVTRPDGSVQGFRNNSGQLEASSDKTYSLQRVADSSNNTIGWQYLNDLTGITENYDANGKILESTDRSGNKKTFIYSTVSTPLYIAPRPDLLIQVVDHFDRRITISYDGLGRISKVTNPQGAQYSFAFAANSNLSTITFPDATTKNFFYESSIFPEALTGISDENSSRFATWTYISKVQGTFANSSEHAGGVNKVTINYNTFPSYVDITNSKNNVFKKIFTYPAILGSARITGQSQPAGSGCAASASSLTYDANGNVASRVDFNGNKTTHVYDLTRNVETSRTEGLTTAGAATTATRTITTSWHSTWRLPLVVSTYTGATASGTAVQRTTYTYDTKGNVTSVQEEDSVRALSRTTTTTYTYSSAVPGLVLQKVVDGPRTDVSDTTTYEYYAHDATCTASTATPIVDPITGVAPANYGCRGQLQKVTNALGHITTYDRYNHHGQLEQMTDANGLVTQQTYDLRQRLLARVESGSGITTQTTQLNYDNAGQITQLKMPDNSTLNYTYDAAHRLTDIQDTLGNKIHYTLDTEGNRTQEDVYDPSNALSTTVTRSFDALNRLQTQTGL